MTPDQASWLVAIGGGGSAAFAFVVWVEAVEALLLKERSRFKLSRSDFFLLWGLLGALFAGLCFGGAA